MVELDEVGHARPRLVGEAVVPLGVTVPVDVEPTGIGAALTVLKHVLKGPEPTPHVIEHAVEQHLDAGLMTGVHHPAQVRIGAQAAVDGLVVARVVAMRVAFEHGVEHEAGGAQLGHVLDPTMIHELQDARFRIGRAIVLIRGTCQPQRIHLIDHGSLIPVHRTSRLAHAPGRSVTSL